MIPHSHWSISYLLQNIRVWFKAGDQLIILGGGGNCYIHRLLCTSVIILGGGGNCNIHRLLCTPVIILGGGGNCNIHRLLCTPVIILGGGVTYTGCYVHQ